MGWFAQISLGPTHKRHCSSWYYSLLKTIQSNVVIENTDTIDNILTINTNINFFLIYSKFLPMKVR